MWIPVQIDCHCCIAETKTTAYTTATSADFEKRSVYILHRGLSQLPGNVVRSTSKKNAVTERGMLRDRLGS